MLFQLLDVVPKIGSVLDQFTAFLLLTVQQIGEVPGVFFRLAQIGFKIARMMGDTILTFLQGLGVAQQLGDMPIALACLVRPLS